MGQTIDATVESHIYQVTLSDAVMTQMIFQSVSFISICNNFGKVRDAELSWIDARVLRRQKIDEDINMQDDGEDEPMEVDNEGNAVESQETKTKRLSQKKRANIFHLEALPQSAIPSHQVKLIYFFDRLVFRRSLSMIRNFLT